MRVRRLAPSYYSKMALRGRAGEFVGRRAVISRNIRNVTIASLLIISMIVALYVSVPDFPYHAESWQLWLWSEPSGWWNEITWIIAFGTLASSALLFRSWFYRLKPTKDLVIRVQLGVLLTVISWDTVAVGYLLYFKPAWPGFYDYFILDRTGTLHGLFYISTAHVAALTLIFGLALVGRFVDIIAKRV